MVSPINLSQERSLFNRLTNTQQTRTIDMSQLREVGRTQKDIFIKAIVENSNSKEPEVQKALDDMMIGIMNGDFRSAVEGMKKILPNDASMKQTSLGTAIMAKGWSKPIVFPNEKSFKWLGWADDPTKITNEEVWTSAYGSKPATIAGAVGNSNIKPEQVRGGCDLSKKELSALYEKSIVEFWNPILEYLIEQGASPEDIGFAFAHSDCGVDKAAREIVEVNGLKGIATTPTEYTQYLRGKECPPSEEFPNGFILADFPFPTILTRNLGQIEDYAELYGKLVGKDNPLGVFGGGDHAFSKDIKESLISKDGSYTIPVDIMKDKHGIIIEGVDKDGNTRNAARKALDRINGNPYEQFKYAAKYWLPSSRKKEDLMQYDPQMAIATIMYTNLAKAGKIGK